MQPNPYPYLFPLASLVYDVYDTCGNDERRRLSDKPKASLLDIYNMRAETKMLVETADSFKLNPSNNAALNDYTCGGQTASDVWLSEPSVIAALHVKAGTVGMQYQETAADLRPLYASLALKYPIIIYSGDVDACVPYVGSERWTRGLGFKVLNDWYEIVMFHQLNCLFTFTFLT